MKSMEELAQQDKLITESLNVQYDNIIKQLQEAKEQQLPLDEGLFGLVGGVTVGPMLMRAVCSALGINEKGALGNLMTSRLILAAVGSKL